MPFKVATVCSLANPQQIIFGNLCYRKEGTKFDLYQGSVIHRRARISVLLAC